MADYFGIRVLYVFVCFCILGSSLRVAGDTVAIASLFLLYFIPLSLDYWTHKPQTPFDEMRKKIGVRVPLVAFTVAIVIIITNVPEINAIISNAWMKYGIWLIIAGPFVLLAILDWIAYSSSREELEYSQHAISAHRNEVEEERITEAFDMINKKKYYQNLKNTRTIKAKNRRRGRRR